MSVTASFCSLEDGNEMNTRQNTSSPLPRPLRSHFSFVLNTPYRKYQIRYGHLAVLKDMESLTPEKVAELAKIIQAKKDADTGKGTDGEPVNVVHIALMEVQCCTSPKPSLLFLPECVDLGCLPFFPWSMSSPNGIHIEYMMLSLVWS